MFLAIFLPPVTYRLPTKNVLDPPTEDERGEVRRFECLKLNFNIQRLAWFRRMVQAGDHE